MLGFSIATTVLVGKYIGEGDKKSAERSAYSGAACSAGYMIIMGVLFVLFTHWFISLFKGEGITDAMFIDISYYARWLLVMLAVLGLFDAINVTFSGALKGAGDTWFTMWISVVMSWLVFAPSVYIVTDVLKTNIFWAWLCFIIYVALLAASYWGRFIAGKWKNIEIREKPAPPIVSETVAEAQIIEN